MRGFASANCGLHAVNKYMTFLNTNDFDEFIFSAKQLLDKEASILGCPPLQRFDKT